MKFLLILPLWVTYVNSYHILCVFPVPSRSHNTLGKGVVDSLLKAGHEVTWATPFPPKEAKKGLNIIDVSVTIPIVEGIDMTKNAKLGMSGLAVVKGHSRNISLAALTPLMKHTLINTQFDAVVTEMFFSEVESGYAAIQQVPWIVLSGIVLQPTLQSLVDAVHSVPVIPMMFTDYAVPMNLWQRIVTAGMYAGMMVVNWLDTTNPALYNTMWAPIAASRGLPLPSYEAALHNISILLVNSHPSFATAHSVPPNVVEVAGYHIDEDIPALPKDLQDLLDSSTKGVVYFSMGSVLKSTSFPEKTRRELLQVFGSLPYTVLWKFEEKMDGLPGNVHIRSWMPQASILAHPNVKVFITHGGILSNLEALYHGVPLIAVPLYGDQPSNANRAVREGYAIKLEYDFDTLAQQVDRALWEILGNDSYYKRAKYLSSLFNKRPVKPSKLISHYIEVAIETKGAYHLRSKSLLYSWYERNMIDITIIIMAGLLIIYYIIKKIIKFLVNLVQGKGRTEGRKRKFKKH